jgi:transposase-like protein
MRRGRKTFSSEFKAKVALEAIKGLKTQNQLSAEYQVHPNAIGNWKKELLQGVAGIFDDKRGPKNEVNQDLLDQLYKQIGKQQVELEWLKKKLNTFT